MIVTTLAVAFGLWVIFHYYKSPSVTNNKKEEPIETTQNNVDNDSKFSTPDTPQNSISEVESDDLDPDYQNNIVRMLTRQLLIIVCNVEFVLQKRVNSFFIMLFVVTKVIFQIINICVSLLFLNLFVFLSWLALLAYEFSEVDTNWEKWT